MNFFNSSLQSCSTVYSTEVETMQPLTYATSSYQRPFSDSSIIVSATIIFSFLVVGVVANGLTILVIVSSNNLSSNVFMRFILSLCVSDLISALISWLFLYRRTWGFDEWSPIPNGLCTFYWSADFMTSYVTSLHILSFAFLRLISIKYLDLYARIQLIHAHIWIGIIWLVGFLCGFVPSMVIFGAETPDRSSPKPKARWPACTVLESKLGAYAIFQHVTFSTFLYVPTIGVVFVCLYIIILVKIRSKRIARTQMQRNEQDKEKQAVIQLVLIIFAFLLGYIPFTVYEFWSIGSHPNEQYYYNFDYWFGMTEYFFLRFSECLNPFFYNLGSAKMRKYTLMYLQKKCVCQNE